MVTVDLIRNIMSCVGLLLIFIGLALYSLPLALVFIGSVLFLGACWGHLRDAAQSHIRRGEEE